MHALYNGDFDNGDFDNGVFRGDFQGYFKKLKKALKVNKGAVRLAVAAGLMLTIGKTASAAPLPPGATISPVGNGAGLQGSGDTEVAAIPSSVGNYNLSIGGGDTYNLTFQIETQIWESPTGTFDFVYQLYNDSVNNNSTIFGDTVQSLTVQSFLGYTLNSDYIAGSGTAPPVSIYRSGDGSIVGFNFYGPTQASELIPGATSDDLVVRTNATSWSLGTASVIGGEVGDVSVQVPYGTTAPVPEPTSLCMVSVAAGSLLGRRRRTAR